MINNLALDIKTKNRCNKCIFSDSKFTLRAVSNTSSLIAEMLKCVNTFHKTKPSSCAGYLAILVSIVVDIIEEKKISTDQEPKSYEPIWNQSFVNS